MIAKEKAKELVDRYYIWTSRDGVNETFAMYDAKQCALICVDEILESHYKVFVGVMPKVYDYWQEVKQEINKL